MEEDLKTSESQSSALVKSEPVDLPASKQTNRSKKKLTVTVPLKDQVSSPSTYPSETQPLDTRPSHHATSTSSSIPLTAPSQFVYPTEVESKIIHFNLNDNKEFIEKTKKAINSFNEKQLEINKPISTNAEGSMGSSGSYFIREGEEKIAIFKPADEELGAKNYPNMLHRGTGDHQRDGIEIGEGVLRECIAPLLGKGIINIPPTLLITLPNCSVFCNHESTLEKRGSLQKFVPNAKTLHQDPAYFKQLLKTSPDAKKKMRLIAIWDLLVFNTDRNRGNLLIAEDKLISIDHGCIAANEFKDKFIVFWFSEEVVKEIVEAPLTEQEIEMINSLNWKERLETISSQLPSLSEDTLNTLRASHMLLIKGAEKKFNLKEIAMLLMPEKDSYSPSVMGCLFALAKKESQKTEKGFTNCLSGQLDNLFKEFNHSENSESFAQAIVLKNRHLFDLCCKKRCYG